MLYFGNILDCYPFPQMHFAPSITPTKKNLVPQYKMHRVDPECNARKWLTMLTVWHRLILWKYVPRHIIK